MSDDGMIKLCHVGDISGKAWDEKGHNKIAQIFIFHGDDGINWIRFQAENGKLKLSQRHGENTEGPKIKVVKLNPAMEYITWISGHTRLFDAQRLCSVHIGFAAATRRL